MSEEFDLALGMGVVTGARSFAIDALGRLTGINYKQVWTPGENLAECRAEYETSPSMSAAYQTRTYRQSDVRSRASNGNYIMFDGFEVSRQAVESGMMNSYQGSITVPVPVPIAAVASVAPKKKPKDHGLTGCSHGFYGYYEGSNDYYREGYVSGVVEAYGETIIGTRGFRATKAKIVALSIDDKVKTPLRKLVQRNYRDVPQFVTFKDMLKQFPTDAGESAISPETDADFWTRKL